MVYPAHARGAKSDPAGVSGDGGKITLKYKCSESFFPYLKVGLYEQMNKVAEEC